MGIFENFPYTNFHELNLDWILSTIQKLDSRIDEFVQTNVLTYADPIQWNITTQYAKNTVVVGPDGTAYMSIAPVPSNILLTNTDYWQPIFNYSETVTVLKTQIASADMEESSSAIVSVPLGGLFWRLNTLYRATKAISAGDGFVVGSNCELCTVEEAVKNVVAPASDIGRSGKNITDSAAETAKRTAKNIIDSAEGDYTESSNHKTVEAAQITEHTTANREIDVDGAHSLHVDGANTINIGGEHTETYGKTFGMGVSGTASYKFDDVVNADFSGKCILKFPNRNAFNLADVVTDLPVYTKNFLNVKDFGAKGDGITDDTTAIQSAITQAETIGGTVYVPAGSYLVSTLTISKGGVTLLGDGFSSVILTSSTANNILSINAQSPNQIGWRISNLHFATKVKRTDGYAIALIGTGENVAVDSCIFFRTGNTEATGSGILIKMPLVFVDNCNIEIKGDFTGICIDGGNDRWINSCWIRGDGTHGDGIKILASGGEWLSNIECVQFKFGFEAVSTNGTISWLNLNNVLCDTNSAQGIRFTKDGNAIQGITLAECWASTNGASANGIGFSITGVAGIQLIGCKALNNGAYGILLQNTTNAQVTGGYAEHNSLTSPNVQAGLILANVNGIVVNSFASGKRTTQESTQNYGISIGGDCDNFIVTACDFRNNKTGINNGAGTSDSRIVENNLV